MFRISLISTLLAGAAAATGRVINQANGDIRSDSAMGRHLMQHARSLENNQQDVSFLGAYSLKFQGCHHVQQWNNEADGEDDVRIKTKRLVRFRLCPADSCTSSASGCSSYYGDYIVDMATFVEAYLTAKEEEADRFCSLAYSECNSLCDSDTDCQATCMTELAFPDCLYNNNNNNNGNQNDQEEFDVKDYAECGQFDFGGGRRLDQNNNNYEEVEYFLGPYCADQGGEIHLGLFTDDTCSTFAQNGESMFYNSRGYELPYSDASLVTSMCLTCAGYNQNGEYEQSELCETVYETSGKCEEKMSISYPSSSSCDYISGIKILHEDGVMRGASTRKSKAAAVSIGFFLTIAVLLGAYVYYLQTKLSRARVNLAAASQTLT